MGSKVESFGGTLVFPVQDIFLRLSEIFVGDFHSSLPQCHQTRFCTNSLFGREADEAEV